MTRRRLGRSALRSSGVLRSPLWLLLLVLILWPAAPAAASHRAVPQGFFGSVVDGPLLTKELSIKREFQSMASSGVETVRLSISWRSAQPYPNRTAIPPGELTRFRPEHDVNGVPTDFSRIDRILRRTGDRRIRVLPTVLCAPDWAAKHAQNHGHCNSPPNGVRPYGRFMAALVRRYGPGGSFWVEHRQQFPSTPIRHWQIWNEPNFAKYYWSEQPFAPGYVRLLRHARQRIRGEDSGARVVLAGLVGNTPEGIQGNYRAIYEAGGRPHFDVAAQHPFTKEPENVIRILRLVRSTMRRYDDASTPLIVSELTWPSSRGRSTTNYAYETTESGQASRLAEVLPLLVKARRELRLLQVHWLTWVTRDPSRGSAFEYSGLKKLRSGEARRKPAFYAYRRAALRYEGCASKIVASGCQRRR